MIHKNLQRITKNQETNQIDEDSISETQNNDDTLTGNARWINKMSLLGIEKQERKDDSGNV